MEMHQVRYFLALSKELNFTRAAKHCGVSQPSLTNGITSLERQFGGPLFRRKPRVMLTALGHAIWPYLNQIACSAKDAHEAALTLVAVPRSKSGALIAQEPEHPELSAAPDSEAAAAESLAVINGHSSSPNAP